MTFLRPLLIIVLAATEFLVLSSARPFAQCVTVCKPNEIVVDEDENTCYCKDRTVFARCIGNAGEQSRSDRRNCAYIVQGVFASAAQGLEDSALDCVVRSLGGGLTVRGTLSSCGLASRYPVRVLEHAVDQTNNCLERVLKIKGSESLPVSANFKI
jgi:hypothetical protein